MPRNRLSAQTYIDGIFAGDRMILSRAITLIESNLSSDRALAADVIQGILPATGKSYRLGITGVPGVGKSTFIDSFGMFLLEKKHRVAVLAVDPSSSITGGSILGDKTRMQRLSLNNKAYVRPSPTGGSLGGVARKTRESLLLCEAAGFDLILVETVGVGQSEVAVKSMVDAFLLLMLPHAGDELQGIKKGIMEMADFLVINKADGKLVDKAKAAKAIYAQALRLFPKTASGWRPPVLTCSALMEQGVDAVYDTLLAFREKQGKLWAQNRSEQQIRWMEESITHLLHEAFFQHPDVKKKLAAFQQQVKQSQLGPMQAAEKLVIDWLNAK